jgi:hypothetical protein
MIKPLKLIAIFSVVALAICLNLYASAGTQNPPARLFETAGMNMPLEQRVGVDDGAAFVVHFAGDTRGSLDVCG